MKTAEDIVKEKTSETVTVTRTQTAREAIDLMNANRIGAILVNDGDEMIGIWTERDFLRNAGDSSFNVQTSTVGEFMTSPLHFAPHDATLTQLEEMFLGLYVRHLPVQKGGQFIGLVSIGDVMRATLLEKDDQIKQLNKLASWQFYENWGWDREKK